MQLLLPSDLPDDQHSHGSKKPSHSIIALDKIQTQLQIATVKGLPHWPIFGPTYQFFSFNGQNNKKIGF